MSEETKKKETVAIPKPKITFDYEKNQLFLDKNFEQESDLTELQKFVENDNNQSKMIVMLRVDVNQLTQGLNSANQRIARLEAKAGIKGEKRTQGGIILN